MTINRHSQEFQQLVARLQAKEITRQQAAEEYRIKPGTLGVWLARSNVREPMNPDGSKELHGAALSKAITDPDKVKALDEAVARVLSGELSANSAAEHYPSLAFTTIAKRVRSAKLAAGATVRKRRTREELARAAGLTQPQQPPAATPEDEDLVRAVLSDPARVAALAKAIREAHV